MFRLKSTAVALFAVWLAAWPSPPARARPSSRSSTSSSPRRGWATTPRSRISPPSRSSRSDGTVNSFTITSVSPERTAPLTLKALGQALDEVKAEDDEFTTRKVEYQSANLEAIHRVLKAEAENATLKGKDADVQAAWTKFREEGTGMTHCSRGAQQDSPPRAASSR